MKLDRLIEIPKQKKRERRMEIDKVKKNARQQHEDKENDNKGDGKLLHSSKGLYFDR